MIKRGMADPTVHACECERCQESPRSAEAMEHRKLNRVVSLLDEKQARRVVGLLAEREGHGGIALLSRVTGMSRTTIAQGQRELVGADLVPPGRMRRPGGGRKSLEKKGLT